MSKQKKTKKAAPLESKSKEILAVILFFLGLFIGVSVFAPYSTGYFGYGFVDVLLKGLFGQSVVTVPFLVCFTAFSLFFSKAPSARWIIFGSLVLMAVSSIFTELSLNGIPLALSFDVSADGGGIFGRILGYVMFNVFGHYGTSVVLVAISLISLMMVFNISIIRTLQAFRVCCEQFALFFSPRKQTKQSKQSVKTFFGLARELSFTLFLNQVTQRQKK